MDNGTNESSAEGTTTAKGKLRWELLTDGLADDCVSLSLVDSRVYQQYPTATLAERWAITLDAIREMVSEGLFEVGDRSGGNDRFAAFDEPLDASMKKIRDAYVANYDDRLGWVFRFWLELTEKGRHVVTSTERGRLFAQEVAEASKRALEATRRDNEGRDR
jgi:hypothetical protein